MEKIVIAVTGASGSIYANDILTKLSQIRDQFSDISLVMSENAKDVWKTELGNENYADLPFTVYAPNDFYAPFASGSAGYSTLIIIPCSMGTLGRIASGISNDLVTRAADVMLKERRKLVCVIRETPYSLVHIRNMESVTLAGGIICPASPSFYSQPSSFSQLAGTVTDRVLDLAGIPVNTFRWGNEKK